MRDISGNHNAVCQLRAKELYIMLSSLALDWWPYVDLCWNRLGVMVSEADGLEWTMHWPRNLCYMTYLVHTFQIN